MKKEEEEKRRERRREKIRGKKKKKSKGKRGESSREVIGLGRAYGFSKINTISGRDGICGI